MLFFLYLQLKGSFGVWVKEGIYLTMELNMNAVPHLRLHDAGLKTGMDLVTLPNYTTVFEFEWKFDHIESQQWMEENWTSAFYYIGIYMLIIFLGQSYMKDRPRFELRVPLVIWNFSLAAFSILGTYRTLPEIYHILNRKNGFHHSVCFPRLELDKTWISNEATRSYHLF